MPRKKISKRKTPIKKIAKKKSQKKVRKSTTKEKTNKTEEPLILQTLRGMKDILPQDQFFWDQVRRTAQRLARDYGFSRIDTPIVEYANLYIKGVGEGTDIVEKEMYTFTTKGRDKVALRPELTVGNCRSYVQNGMHLLPKPVKLFSTGPVFRYDRPQKGRYREHHQVNFDAFGEQDPILDAQIIQIVNRLIQSLGIKTVQIQVNSIGCSVCRKDYKDLLVNYLESKKSKLCKDCKRRIYTNPLRVLDCKEDKCSQVAAAAPQSVDHLCTECHTHFKTLLEYLDELDLPYMINPHLVRGLDYYTKTVFEIWSEVENGKKLSLGGGGRYDNLIKSIGGKDTPAIGFAVGIERLVAEMKRVQAKPYKPPKPKVFLAQLGSLAKRKSLQLFSELEKNGILVAESFGRGTLRSQLKVANKLGVEITLILGQKETLDKTVIIKNMTTGVQETVNMDKLINIIKKRLKSNNVVVYRNKQNK